MKDRSTFLFTHLALGHQYWKNLVTIGDTVIDATCGNGHDTLALASLCLSASSGNLFAIDINPKAIELTKQRLEEQLSHEILSRIHLINCCHSHFPEEIQQGSVKLIVYNLGYLPGSHDKSKTTQTEITLNSIQIALTLLQKNGLLSITCYPGHLEGQREQQHLLSFAATLNPKDWICCHHQWMNRNQAPSLLILQKK